MSPALTGLGYLAGVVGLALIAVRVYESVRIDSAEKAKDAAVKQLADVSAQLTTSQASLKVALADVAEAQRQRQDAELRVTELETQRAALPGPQRLMADLVGP